MTEGAMTWLLNIFRGGKTCTRHGFCIPKERVDIPIGSKTLAIIRKDGELDDKSSDFLQI